MSDNTITTESGIEIYTHDIYKSLDDYRADKCIDDLSSISQSKWNSLLLYIYDNVFKSTDKLKVNGNVNNAYDITRVNDVCDIYIRICYENEKEITQKGFSKMTGITEETLTSWDRGEDRLGSSGSELHKKLLAEKEECLEGRLYDGKQNPVGVLGILNRYYGWNMGQPRTNDSSKGKSTAQIAQEYGLQPEQIADKPSVQAIEALPDADF